MSNLILERQSYAEFADLVDKSHSGLSRAEIVAKLPTEEREAFFKGLSPEQVTELQYLWSFWARPKQRVPEGDWFTWLILAGRGFGKTRTGAETILQWQNEGFSKFALIGQTVADVRDVMVNGPSGIVTIANPRNKPAYIASKRVVRWDNGAEAHIYSGDEPEQLRGPGHEKGWIDELVKFKYLQECLDMFEMGLREGRKPQYVSTTTPKPLAVLKDMVADSATRVTVGSSFENISNLAPVYVKRIIKKYVGTRLGRQELFAELFKDTAGALWHTDLLDNYRLAVAPTSLLRICVAVDPATTNNARSDATGIIVAGIDEFGHGYVLADLTLKASPLEWGNAVAQAYRTFNADVVVGEVNQGGDLVPMVVRTNNENINFVSVHARRGKHLRAEPVAALYEQGRIHHCGTFKKLEEELTEWVPGDASPNRLDALVWAFTELLIKDDEIGEIRAVERIF